MRHLFFLICLALAACSDEAFLPTDAPTVPLAALTFRTIVIEEPTEDLTRESTEASPTRAISHDTSDPYITRDFQRGDTLGLFILDTDGNFVSSIDGHPARNIPLTTPDGQVWNVDSEIKEIVHRLGYRYLAYAPYSTDFDDCARPDDIQARFTTPPADQSTRAATDWLYTEPTTPGTNAVTTLAFHHRFALIDIYHSFTQDHVGDWTSAYRFTHTTDEDGVEHYRYLADIPTAQTIALSGTYTIGNAHTGIKAYTYACDGITVANGRHAIVYTYRVDERCAVDLGLPSGIRWSPINLGTESGTYMDAAEIDRIIADASLGKRLAWGELFEKDSYTLATYIDPGFNILPTDITHTTYDPARQLWGGHWTLPLLDDINELIAYTEEVDRQTIHSDAIDRDVHRITLRSRINGREISLITTGYMNNTRVDDPTFLFYPAASRTSADKCSVLKSPTATANSSRPLGYCLRPVLKELTTHDYAERQAIVTARIDELAVDFGITKVVTEVVDGVEKQVTYRLLWSPFNYGVDSETPFYTYNLTPADPDAYIDKCMGNLGMRIAWGQTERPTKFSTIEYADGPLTQKYNYDNTASTDKDTRDLLPEDDIVQTHWPAGWCIPTAHDFELLLSNTTIRRETINGHGWFRITGTGDYAATSILIPATGYRDDTKDNVEYWAGDAYLQSATIGTKSDDVKGATGRKRTIYTLWLSGNGGSLFSEAGRPTGLMVRPVKYVRVNTTP